MIEVNNNGVERFDYLFLLEEQLLGVLEPVADLLSLQVLHNVLKKKKKL